MRGWCSKRFYRYTDDLLAKQISTINSSLAFCWYYRKKLIKALYTLAARIAP
jgi:hypothetical protein